MIQAAVTFSVAWRGAPENHLAWHTALPAADQALATTSSDGNGPSTTSTIFRTTASGTRSIDGELFVSPPPSARHQRTLGILCRRVADYLDRGPAGYVFFALADVTFSPKRGLQPDPFVAPAAGGRFPESFPDVKRLLFALASRKPSTRCSCDVTTSIMRQQLAVARRPTWTASTSTRTSSTPVAILAEQLGAACGHIALFRREVGSRRERTSPDRRQLAIVRARAAN